MISGTTRGIKSQKRHLPGFQKNGKFSLILWWSIQISAITML